MFTFDNNKELD